MQRRRVTLQFRILLRHHCSDGQRGRNVGSGCVRVLECHAVVLGHCRQGALAPAETVHLLVQDEGVDDGVRGRGRQPVPFTFPGQDGEVIAGVERQHGDAGGEHTGQHIGNLGRDRCRVAAFGTGPFVGDAVDCGSLCGDGYVGAGEPLVVLERVPPAIDQDD